MNNKPFTQLEQEHKILISKTRQTGLKRRRSRSIISLSAGMLEFLQSMQLRPMRHTEGKKIHISRNYIFNKLHEYGFVRKEIITHAESSGTTIPIRPTSLYFITEKGRKMLEVLEMPNE